MACPFSPARLVPVHRPRAELLITSVVEKRLGSLPASAHFLRRLDVAGIIDLVLGAEAGREHGPGPALDHGAWTTLCST